MTISSTHLFTKVEYPDTDGKPMAESDFQRNPLMYAVAALARHFRDDPNVYVSGDLLLYYQEGKPEAVIAPDVFVVIGAPKKDRASYMLWKEPKGPDFVIEITSRSTWSQDQGPKKGIYALLGVREYFQYDPTNDYLNPPLQGSRLVDNNYLPIPPTTLADGTLSLPSNTLGLDLRLAAGELRFYDPTTERKLLTYDESEEARAAAEEALESAAARIIELEAKLQALEGNEGGF